MASTRNGRFFSKANPFANFLPRCCSRERRKWEGEIAGLRHIVWLIPLMGDVPMDAGSIAPKDIPRRCDGHA
jgi:hypothetical protein